MNALQPPRVSRQRPIALPNDPNSFAERSARILIWLYVASTVAGVLVWLMSRSRQPTFWLELVFWAINVPVTGTFASIVALVLITRALVGRKRVGLIVVGLMQGMGLLFGLVSFWGMLAEAIPFDWYTALDVFQTALSGALLFWVIRMRSAFPGHLQRGSWIGAGVMLTVGAAISIIPWALHRTLNPVGTDHLRQLFAVLKRSVGLTSPATRAALVGVPLWIPQVTSLLIGATLIAAVLAFLRPGREPDGWTGEKEVRLRELLAESGASDSLAYFSTRRDRSTIFSADGRAAVTYRVVYGVCLAAGDPVGDRESWPDAIARWKDRARYYGWLPAALSTSEAGARAYVAAGMGVVPFGDEAILDADGFALAGPSRHELRQAVQRARRAGVTVEVRRQAEVGEAELAQLVQAADDWRHGRTERGFSMALNRLGDPADNRTLIVTAKVEGRLVGLLSFVPWGRRGASLDVMRRSPDAPNGTTQAMVAGLMEAGPELGLNQVSLNFCMFRSVYADADRLGAGPATRLNYSVLGRLDRLWQLERLYRSSQQYGPAWAPRYLCFDSQLTLPRIAIAAGMAEGFLPGGLPFGRRSIVPGLTAGELEQVRALEAPVPPDLDRIGPVRTQQTRVRIDRLAQLRAAGREPYPPAAGEPTAVSALGDASWAAPELLITGRVERVRDHGGIVFADVTEGGTKLQAIIEAQRLGRDQVRCADRQLDIGDLVVLRGQPGTSRSGTRSLLVDDWTMAAKSLHPVPFTGFNDPELRLRQRSTDLIVHPDQVRLLRDRGRVVRALRDVLVGQGFTEVETPMLHAVHGGASARPFQTHINAYNADLTLRIAPELYLKRLLVGGLGPLFEIGRSFRNEGADATHNPEFTSLEAYRPYGDYNTMRLLTQRLVQAAATAVHGRPALPIGPDGALVDIGGDWPVVPVLAAVTEALGRPVDLATDLDDLRRLADANGVHVRAEMGAGALIEELYGKLVESATVVPTFYTDFPVETSPLARAHRSLPGLAERWDLVANAMEIGTAYTELTDPIDQRRRLTEQSLKAAAGDAEAMEVDEDFLRALETGMPPAGGLGLGVDRVAMLITASNIRDVLTFPFARPLPAK